MEGSFFSFLKSKTVFTIVVQPLDFAFFRRAVRLSCITGTSAVPPKTTISDLKKSSSSSSGLYSHAAPIELMNIRSP